MFINALELSFGADDYNRTWQKVTICFDITTTGLTQKSPNKFYYLQVEKCLKIIDSFQFLKASLQRLVYRYTESYSFHYLKEGLFKEYNISETDELYKLLSKQKGSFPFDFCDEKDKLLLQDFPEKSNFYNQLRECDISDIDYFYAKQIYDLSNCKNLADF